MKLPTLESYSVELAPPTATPTLDLRETPRPRLQITLHGQRFVERAMMLVIKIGDVFVQDYTITPDQRQVICLLDDMPEDGALISIGYSSNERVELPERFSRSKLRPHA